MLAWSGQAALAEPSSPSAQGQAYTLQYEASTAQLTVVSSESAPLPVHRVKRRPEGDEWLLQYEDGLHEMLGQLPIPDPTLLHTETGAQANAQPVPFVVVLPQDARIAFLRLLRPQLDSEGRVVSLEAMATGALSQAP